MNKYYISICIVLIIIIGYFVYLHFNQLYQTTTIEIVNNTKNNFIVKRMSIGSSDFKEIQIPSGMYKKISLYLPGESDLSIEMVDESGYQWNIGSGYYINGDEIQIIVFPFGIPIKYNIKKLVFIEE